MRLHCSFALLCRLHLMRATYRRLKSRRFRLPGFSDLMVRSLLHHLHTCYHNQYPPSHILYNIHDMQSSETVSFDRGVWIERVEETTGTGFGIIMGFVPTEQLCCLSSRYWVTPDSSKANQSFEIMRMGWGASDREVIIWCVLVTKYKGRLCFSCCFLLLWN